MVILLPPNTDIFESDAHVIVNPVNTDGYMGAGLAMRFKEMFPQMYDAYRKACVNGSFKAGTVLPYQIPGSTQWVVSLPTKVRWQKPSDIDVVKAGLHALRAFMDQNSIVQVCMPALGCGLGGLRFEVVRKEIEEVFSHEKYVVHLIHPRNF